MIEGKEKSERKGKIINMKLFNYTFYKYVLFVFTKDYSKKDCSKWQSVKIAFIPFFSSLLSSLIDEGRAYMIFFSYAIFKKSINIKLCNYVPFLFTKGYTVPNGRVLRLFLFLSCLLYSAP